MREREKKSIALFNVWEDKLKKLRDSRRTTIRDPPTGVNFHILRYRFSWLLLSTTMCVYVMRPFKYVFCISFLI